MGNEEDKFYARRSVVEKLTYALIETASKVNDDVGEDISYIELLIAFTSAQNILMDEMERQENEK